MTTHAWAEAQGARTLVAAHAAVLALRPAPDAPPAAWAAFRGRASAIYRRVAEFDPDHEGEARYWANREKAKADALASGLGSTARRDFRGTDVPATLAAAHDVLQTLRPAVNASPQAWLTFHQHAAHLYLEVSDVDRTHHHEALSCASQARAEAARFITGLG